MKRIKTGIRTLHFHARWMSLRAWPFVAAGLIALALLGAGLRLWFPSVESYEPDIEQWLSDNLGSPVSIGSLRARWRGWAPELQMQDLEMLGEDGQPLLKFREAAVRLDILRSLLSGSLKPHRLTVTGVRLSLVLTPDGRLRMQGLAVGDDTVGLAVAVAFLNQTDLELTGAELVWEDRMARIPPLSLVDVSMRLRSSDARHQLQGEASIAGESDARIRFVIDTHGDLATDAWDAQLFVTAADLHLQPLLTGYLPSSKVLKEGLAGFRIWSTWKGAKLADLAGDFDLRELRWASAAGSTAVTGAQGRLALEKGTQGWALALSALRLHTDDGPRPPAHIEILRETDGTGAGGRISGRASSLFLEDAVLPLLATPGLEPALADRLRSADPRGKISELAFIYQTDAPLTRALHLKARLDEARLRLADGKARLRDLTGWLFVAGDEGHLRLDDVPLEVDLPEIFEQPIGLDSVTGEIHWRRLEDAWLAESTNLLASNSDFRSLISGRVEWRGDDGSPFFKLIGRLEDGDGTSAAKYLPAGILPPKATKWLTRAIVGGRLTRADLLLHGRAADLPFDRGEGRLEVRANVTDGILDYAEDWPRIEEIDAEVVVSGRSLEVRSPAARVLDADVLRAEARIADLAADLTLLQASGKATASAADGLRFLLQSPLRERFAAKLDGAEATGRIVVDLNLEVVLERLSHQVDGTVFLKGNDLSSPPLALALEGVTGELAFTGDSLQGQNLSARMQEFPVSLYVDTVGPEERPITQLRAEGRVTTAELSELLGRELGATGLESLMARVEGETSWQATLQVPVHMGADDSQPIVRLESPLQGVALRFPPPLGKAVGEKRPLMLETAITPGDTRVVRLAYGDTVKAVLAVETTEEKRRLARAAVYLGAAKGGLPPDEGLYVKGDLPELSTTQWLEVMNGQEAGTGAASQESASTLSLREVDVKGQRLELMGRWIEDTRLVAHPQPSGAWRTRLTGPTMSGVVNLPAQGSDAPITMTFDRFSLPAPAPGQLEDQRDPRALPSLEFSCHEFSLEEVPLGILTVITRPRPWGLRVEQLKLAGDGFELTATGDWQFEKGEHVSRFKIRLDSPNVGKMLSGLGYEQVTMAGGQTSVDIDASWNGSPTEFALERVNGVLKIETRKGRLVDVNPGAGRVLGLVSLQALPRRLQLDFSDLFKKGFTYDRIEGVFTIDDGDAYTNNLSIRAPSARIDIAGRVGLATQDYDQIVTVTPVVSSAALPIAGAIAGGPLGAAAGFLATRLFGGKIDKASKVQYQITGSWEDPRIEPLGQEPRSADSEG